MFRSSLYKGLRFKERNIAEAFRNTKSGSQTADVRENGHFCRASNSRLLPVLSESLPNGSGRTESGSAAVDSLKNCHWAQAAESTSARFSMLQLTCMQETTLNMHGSSLPTSKCWSSSERCQRYRPSSSVNSAGQGLPYTFRRIHGQFITAQICLQKWDWKSQPN